jgi:hypothetical protein
MVCDTRVRRKGQTLTERKEEVKKAVTQLDLAIASRRVKVKVGPQGAVAFEGWAEQDRAAVSDACAYRRIISTGSALTRAAIAQAEQLAGRTVNKTALTQGHHSHDGGATWHKGH